MKLNKSSTVIEQWKKQCLDGMTPDQWVTRANQINRSFVSKDSKRMLVVPQGKSTKGGN